MTVSNSSARQSRSRLIDLLGLLLVGGAILLGVVVYFSTQGPESPAPELALHYAPRKPLATSGYNLVASKLHWPATASLQEIARHWDHAGYRLIEALPRPPAAEPVAAAAVMPRVVEAVLYNYEGQPGRAYDVLQQLRTLVEQQPELAEAWLCTIIYYQGVSGLRQGENDNCVDCRGDSACILPLAPAAVHRNPTGSRRAIQHFTEYLQHFPDDLEVRWLLNLAHMTLGEHPDGVDPRFRITLERFRHSEFDIGRFHDIAHLAGVNRLNLAGGAIMDDFDNDGLLDLATTSSDPTQPLALYRNQGDGTFVERTAPAQLTGQLGGLYCVQADYDNDGRLDIFIARGGWLQGPMPPSLLHNNGDGTFRDVTQAAGLLHAANIGCAAWADFDNDGLLDLFIGCETSVNRLYHNNGDGTFEDATGHAGVYGTRGALCKGCAWIDYDNDGYPDLFVNNYGNASQLYHNNRDGTFHDVSAVRGIDGPHRGFACWAWDYDNDGWLDLFATSYDRTLQDVVKGLVGQPHERASNRLFHNEAGKGFKDVTHDAGLDLCFATMGSNFGDFDNDGWLDMYLGTGEPDLATLVPNRMFKNVAGQRFAEITGTSGTGHLQKGHGVACGDWRRSGNLDIFIEMGGAVPGDRYHNVLFLNPGQGNHWLTLKLVGKQTNRAAIGARIKAVTAGAAPLTVQRHVTSGSSFGANPLQQTLGLGKAERLAELEVHWPTSGTTQVFHDIAVDQALEITEFADHYRQLPWTPIAPPK